MVACDNTDFMYPLLADVYYSITSQGAYGDVNRTWVLDKTVACSFAMESRKNKQQIPTGVELLIDDLLIGRTRSDLRYTSDGSANPLTSILITNIRDINENSIYNETSGPRNGKTTLFEVKTNEPVVGPFGSVEYHKVVIRRSENQGVDV
jgi:hypothetical protein